MWPAGCAVAYTAAAYCSLWVSRWSAHQAIATWHCTIAPAGPIPAAPATATVSGRSREPTIYVCSQPGSWQRSQATGTRFASPPRSPTLTSDRKIRWPWPACSTCSSQGDSSRPVSCWGCAPHVLLVTWRADSDEHCCMPSKLRVHCHIKGHVQNC